MHTCRRSARFVAATLLLLAFLAPTFPASAADPDGAPFSLSPTALIATAASVRVPETAGVSMLRSEQTYRIGADGRVHYVYYSLYRILKEKSADGWDEVVAQWSPWKDRRPELRARVIAADGREYTLDPKTIIDSPVAQGSNSVYSDTRSLRAPLPAIGPGAIVEAEVTGDEGSALAGVGFVRRIRFQYGEPVQRFRVRVFAPKTMPFGHRADLLPDLRVERSESNGESQWTFEAGPMEALGDIEPGLPRDVHAVPLLTISTGSSWRELADRYSAVVDERIAQSDVTALAERLTKDRTTRESKIAAVVEYLNREIRYTGIEFDEAAIVPHAPAETLRFKYGDCKDKATLLVALLRASGIGAYVALLDVGARVDVPEDQPGLGLFDHAIVYVPGEPDHWIDATADTSRLGQLPSGDADRLVLIARPGTEALVRTPALRSAENVIVEERTIHLADYGPARVVEVSLPRGVFEADYRESFSDVNGKERRDGLIDYVKKEYGAERLARAERSDPRDFATPFSLTLEATRASGAYTGLSDVAVYMRRSPLFERLPDDLQTREPTEQENAKATRPRPKRTADYRLERPYSAEYRYRLVPPSGFEPGALPESATRLLGPARLETTFTAEPDGTVLATLRFDTVKSRFTAAEATALRNGVADVLGEDAPRVQFELSASVLAARGEAKKSFEAYRALVARTPNSAIAHVRRAEGLLQAGMGEAARAAARRAVQLEPKSAIAQAELARVLQHDLIGREYAEGADRAGAAAAWRAAAAADPDDKSHVVNLAILLEHDDQGIRYSPRANLAGAIAEYQHLTATELANTESQYNLPYTLLYARRFAEAKRAALALSSPPLTVAIAAEAMLTDPAHAIDESRRMSSGEANRSDILRTAGVALMNLREYERAAPLIEAGARGQNAAQMLNLATTLRQTRRLETLPPTTDVGEIARRIAARFTNPSFSFDEYLQQLSRSARQLDQSMTPAQRRNLLLASRAVQRAATSSGLLPGALADIGFRAVNAHAFGSDAVGYRVSLQAPGQATTPDLFLVKEDGEYRILANAGEPAAIGVEVLARLDRGDLAGARSLLDLLRDADRGKSSDDPYADGAFRLLWTEPTAAADAARTTTAAAALLTNSDRVASRGVKLLEAVRASVPDAERGPIELALFWGYTTLEDRERALEAATSLHARAPTSRIGFEGRVRALYYLGRDAEADALVAERLARMPADLVALRLRARGAQQRKDYPEAHARWKAVVASGRAEAGDYNEVAWASLFLDRGDGPDVESAGRATQLMPTVPSYLHTLGCVYAELGRTKEARDILMNALLLTSLADPDGNYWYAFGRIAEHVGELDVARAYYAKVEPPERAAFVQATSWQLAQRRLAAMDGRRTAATK
jgi:transglutaminase-like putative cysteine protease